MSKRDKSEFYVLLGDSLNVCVFRRDWTSLHYTLQGRVHESSGRDGERFTDTDSFIRNRKAKVNTI